MRGIARRPSQQRITILQMILPVSRASLEKVNHPVIPTPFWLTQIARNRFLQALSQYSLPAEELSPRDLIFNFDQNPQDVAVVLSFFLDVLLYTPQPQSQAQAADAGSVPTIPPGLSPRALATSQSREKSFEPSPSSRRQRWRS